MRDGVRMLNQKIFETESNGPKGSRNRCKTRCSKRKNKEREVEVEKRGGKVVNK